MRTAIKDARDNCKKALAGFCTSASAAGAIPIPGLDITVDISVLIAMALAFGKLFENL